MTTLLRRIFPTTTAKLYVPPPAPSTTVTNPTVDQLVHARENGLEVTIFPGSGGMVYGVPTRVRREDGSGKCWLVTIRGQEYFIRTAYDGRLGDK